MRSQSEVRLTLILSRRHSLLLVPLFPVFPLSVSPLAHVPQEGGRGLVLAVVEGGGVAGREMLGVGTKVWTWCRDGYSCGKKS